MTFSLVREPANGLVEIKEAAMRDTSISRSDVLG